MLILKEINFNTDKGDLLKLQKTVWKQTYLHLFQNLLNNVFLMAKIIATINAYPLFKNKNIAASARLSKTN